MGETECVCDECIYIYTYILYYIDVFICVYVCMYRNMLRLSDIPAALVNESKEEENMTKTPKPEDIRNFFNAMDQEGIYIYQ